MLRVRPKDKLDEACNNADELAWIWTDFLSKQRRATDFVETAGGRAANDSLHDARARLKISLQ